MRKFTALILIPIITGCATYKFQDLNTVFKEYKINNPSQSDFSDDEAVYILNKSNAYIEFGEMSYSFVNERHVIKKLFKNIEDHSSVKISISFDEEIEKIHARTIKPTGEVVEINKEDFYKSYGYSHGSIFYADIKSISFTFPNVEPNDIIEYEYVTKSSDPLFFQPWRIQYSIPTIKSIYTLKIPEALLEDKMDGGAGWGDWNFKIYNVNNKIEEVTKATRYNEEMTIIYEFDSIPSFKPEQNMPAWDKYVQFMVFASPEWETWDDVSKWYYKKYFKPQLKITKEIESLALKLTSGLNNTQEKIDTLYKYVQNIRYVAIEIGKGGIKPRNPQKVLDNRYGDCKDKSILLISLLESIGIKSSPVLMLTNNIGTPDKSFPSWRFNHMIVLAYQDEKNVFWLDPTAKYCSLGDLPLVDQGTFALIINDDGTSIQALTPTRNQDFNIIQNRCLISPIIKQKQILYKTKTIFKGQDAIALKYYIEDLNENEKRTLLIEEYLDHFNGVSITDLSFKYLNDNSSFLELDLSFVVPYKSDELIVLPQYPLQLINIKRLIANDSRKYPLYLDYERTISRQTILNCDTNTYRVYQWTDNGKIENEFISLWSNIESNGSQYIENSELVIKHKYVYPEYYQYFKAHADKIDIIQNKKIIIETKNGL